MSRPGYNAAGQPVAGPGDRNYGKRHPTGRVGPLRRAGFPPGHALQTESRSVRPGRVVATSVVCECGARFDRTVSVDSDPTSGRELGAVRRAHAAHAETREQAA